VAPSGVVAANKLMIIRAAAVCAAGAPVFLLSRSVDRVWAFSDFRQSHRAQLVKPISCLLLGRDWLLPLSGSRPDKSD
jgi:hypothetical protein